MRILIYILVFCSFTELYAQNRRSLSGFFPEAQISYSLPKKFKIVGKIESQNGFITNTPNSETDVRLFSYRNDFQGFIDKKITPFISVAIGYQYRIEGGDDVNSHRSIQQISFLQKFNKYRIKHRVRFDQLYANSIFPEFRVRYRLALEIALQGNELDPGEFYLVFSEELIYGIEANESKLENRTILTVGHFFTNKQKLEVGIDYRIDGFISNETSTRHRTWLRVGWFVNL